MRTHPNASAIEALISKSESARHRAAYAGGLHRSHEFQAIAYGEFLRRLLAAHERFNEDEIRLVLAVLEDAIDTAAYSSSIDRDPAHPAPTYLRS